MTAAMGVGAVVGGLVVAAKGRTGLPTLVLAAAAFGVVLLFACVAPTLPVELFALALAAARASRSCRPATRPCSWPPLRACAVA